MKTYLRFIHVTGITLSLVVPGYSRGADCDPNVEVVTTGRYVNDDYGYSIELPGGIQACRLLPPAPQHGLTVHLKHDPASEIESEIQVYAEYDALLLGSAQRLAETASHAVVQAFHLRKATDSGGKLAGLNTRSVVLRGRNGRDGINYVHILLAFRPVPGEVGISYVVLLQDRREDANDEDLFTKIAASLKLLPVR